MTDRVPWLHSPAPKAAGSFDRMVPIASTAALIPELRRRFNITRVGETTHLDYIGIPTMCAVVADSPDGISVYNGKGPTKEHATCSAVMEAVERQCGATLELPTVIKRPRNIDDGLDFVAMGMLEDAFDSEIPFVSGVDLLSGDDVCVPFAAVRCPWYGRKTFAWSTSHGLASGNTLLEATYHALFEMAERHVWAMTHTRAHVRPRLLLEELAQSIGKQLDISHMVDDPAATEVALPTGNDVIDGLVKKIVSTGLRFRLTAMQEADLPIAMIASVSDARVDPPLAHHGLGCSWSPAHAALRAITEAVQSRAVDIQGSREDLLRADSTNLTYGSHGKRRTTLPHGRWYYDAPLPAAELSALSDRSTSCIAEELRMLLAAFRNLGERRIVVVDLSPPGLPVSVVRVVAPELESAFVDGRVGRSILRLLAAG